MLQYMMKKRFGSNAFPQSIKGPHIDDSELSSRNDNLAAHQSSTSALPSDVSVAGAWSMHGVQGHRSLLGPLGPIIK